MFYIESVCTALESLASRDFLINLEFSDSTFRIVVVREYSQFVKEVEDIVPALDYSV